MSIVKIQVEGDDADGVSDDEFVVLKERSATALEQAFGFLEREASRLELDRARVLLGIDPPDPWIEGWATAQAADGSLPAQGIFAGGDAGGPDLEGQTPPIELLGTLESLMVLADADRLAAPCVEAAGLYLRGLQQDDGGFGSASTPEPMRIFVTGMIAGLLGQTTTVRPDLLLSAGDFLAPRFSPEAVENGRWSAVAAFGTFFSNNAHDMADEALQWCGRELERGYRSGRYEAGLTVRALLHCDALALPGASLDPLELLDRLLGEQASDGGFAELAPGGRPARVTPTVDGLHSIVSLCQRF